MDRRQLKVNTRRPSHLSHGCIAACNVVLCHTVGLRYPREIVAYEILRLHRKHVLELDESLRHTRLDLSSSLARLYFVMSARAEIWCWCWDVSQN